MYKDYREKIDKPEKNTYITKSSNELHRHSISSYPIGLMTGKLKTMLRYSVLSIDENSNPISSCRY